jgi:hypothetical protein
MNAASPITESQLLQDSEHIRLLAAFHFILRGLALVGIPFICLHYFMMSSVFANPEMWKSAKNVEPQARAFFEHFFQAFVWFYLFMGVVCLAASILNILSGVFLRQKKHRMFSVIVAGLNCLQIPFGTALGVLTLIVLMRDSVRQSYEA